MKEKPDIELTIGSVYRIISIGGRDNSIETKGIFKGYMTIGVEEIGLLLEMDKYHGDLTGKIRIIPLHAILAIDVLKAKPNRDKEDKEIPNYVG